MENIEQHESLTKESLLTAKQAYEISILVVESLQPTFQRDYVLKELNEELTFTNHVIQCNIK